MKNNYLFINKKPKNFFILNIIYLILFVSAIIFLSFLKTYDKKVLKGVVINNQIVIPINVLDEKIITGSKYIKIDNRKYNLDIIEISEVYSDGNINMQDVKIKFNNKKYFDNQIVEVTIYYEYDYLIKKIVRGVFE